MMQNEVQRAVEAYLKSCHLKVDFYESHVYYEDSKLTVTLESPSGETLLEAQTTLPSWERSKRSDW